MWVNGGSVANLLAVWDVHDLRPAMRAAWEAGVVLGGVSAGSICWYVGGCTDSFGPELRAVTNGLGLLPYGSGVHYDSEETRRPTIHRLVGDGTLPETHCTDDGVGLVYRGTELVEAVSETGGKGAYVVTRTADGVREERLEPRRLPLPLRPALPTSCDMGISGVGRLHGDDPLLGRRDPGGVDDGEGVHGVPRVDRHRWPAGRPSRARRETAR